MNRYFFGFIGEDNNYKIQKNWINNVGNWCKIFQKSEYKKNKNFFCYIVDFETDIKSLISVDSFIDGNIFYNNEVINDKSRNYDNSKLREILSEGKCYGQYTCCLYDNINLELNFFNDYYGSKPIYYYEDNKKNLFFANDIRVLLTCKNISFIPNLNKCKKICTYNGTMNEDFDVQTFYAGIIKMPGGTHLSIKNGTIKFSTVYHPEIIDKKDYIVFDQKKKYFSLFRNTLNDIIKKYVESSSSKNIGVSLSGGIDSAVILAALIDLGYKDRVICYHATSNNPRYYSCNDSEIVKNLLKYLGVKGKIFYQNDGNSICNAVIGRDYIKNIDGPCCNGNDSFGFRLLMELENDNVSLIFGGDGGDYLFTGTKYCFDMIKYNHLERSVKEREKEIRSKHINLLKYKIFPFIPWIKDIEYKKIFWGDDDSNINKYPDYFSQEMKKANKLEKGKSYCTSKKLKIWSRRFIYDMMFPKAYADDEQYDGFDFVHPLLDKKIYDFAQRVPPYIHYDVSKGELGGYIVQKRILREAYSDILPNFIIEQKYKTNYAPSLILRLLREKDNILNLVNGKEQIFLEKYGIVNGDKFRKKLNVYFSNIEDPHFVLNFDTKYICTLLYLEIWFREINKGRKWMLESSKIDKKIRNKNIEVINEKI